MEAGIRKILIVASFSLLLCIACRKERPFVASNAYQSAEAEFRRGDLQLALAETDNALRLMGGTGNDAVWRFRLLKAEILIWQGLSQDALILLKDTTLHGPTLDELSARRNSLMGVAESNLQQLDLAQRTFAETEKMPGAQSPQIMGDLLLGEGKLAALHHDPQESELLFNRALQIAQQHGQTFLAGKALGNLGVLQMRQHRYAEAVDRFNAALAVAQELGAKTMLVKTTLNLGWGYLQMGDLDRASNLFEQAEEKSIQLGMIADQTSAVLNIAVIRFAQRDFAASERDYQQALQLARRMGNQQEMAFSLTDLAQIAMEKQDFNLAEKYNSEALAVEHSIGDYDTELYSLVNKARIAASKKDYNPAEQLLRGVVHDAGANLTLQAQAFDALAKIDTQQDRVKAAMKHYTSAIAMLEKGRASLGREELQLSYPTNSKEIYNDYVDFLMERGMTNEAFSVAELHRARTLNEGLGLERELGSQSFGTSDAKRVAARLGHVVLSYWLGPERSYLWFFASNRSQVFVLPGEDQIRPLVESYRSHLTGTLDFHDVSDGDGQRLYKILVGPVEGWIQPDTQVTIIPDGALCGLNFETLIVNSSRPHYWIEDVAITNAGSMILLASKRRSAAAILPQTTKTLLLIGNPKLPEYYSPIAHAGDEMRLIQKQFDSAEETVLSGGEATPAAFFKAKPEDYALIHFVAHGTASRVSPLDSAVVLSEDGSSHNLYARDIAHAKLHARLVTISACDSAGNRIYSTEGLVGLSWAFLRAGSQQVIAALWEVNDTSTPQLMNSLYAGIAAGQSPAAALRTAKLALLRSHNVYNKPFYWAPFVLYEGA